jgi:hypothetical protein
MTSLREFPSALANPRPPRRLALAAAGLWLACQSLGLAQGVDQSRPSLADELGASQDSWIVSPNTSTSGSIAGGAPVNGPYEPGDIGSFGVNARVGHVGGGAVGREESMTFLEFAPFTAVENLFFAGDVRLLRTNDGELASSIGGIVRRYMPRTNGIAGLNFYFDNDGSRGPTLQELGIGFEYLTTGPDLRINGYFPINDKTKRVRTGIIRGSEIFQGNQLFFNQLTEQVTASNGTDITLTYPVPGQWASTINLEASAGAYYYSPVDSGVRDFLGWRARLDTTLARRLLHAYVELTGDRVNDNLASVGVDINYWRRYDDKPRTDTNSYHRINEWVRRNWTVVGVDEPSIQEGILATDANGDAYFFEHVDSNSGAGGNGTFENPYQTLQTAQTNGPGPGDSIIYAHAGSVFNTPLVMNDNEIIIGEGVTTPLPRFGSLEPVILPPSGNPGGKPVFDSINGVAPVTLASNVTFGGFDISNTTGGPPAAIVGDGIDSARLFGITIQDVDNGGGILFNNVTGDITLDNVNMLRSNPMDTLSGIDGDNFVVQNSNANITYTNSEIENTLGRMVHIDNSAGRIDLSDVLLNSRFAPGGGSDDGVLIENSSADVLLGQMEIDNGTIDLLNNTGDISFLGPIDMRNSGGNTENPTGIPLQVNGSTGRIVFAPGASLDITGRADTGIDLRNISGLIRFDDDVTIIGGDFFSEALVWQQNSGTFIMTGDFTAGAESPDGPAQSTGILIGDRFGLFSNQAGSTFRMLGQFNIFNTYGETVIDPVTPISEANSAIAILEDPTNVIFSGGIINGRNPEPPAPLVRLPTGGIQILNTTGTIAFNGTTVIGNEPIDATDPLFDPLSGVAAVNMLGASGLISFETLTITDATTAPALIGIGNEDISFDELNITYIGDAGVVDTAVVLNNNGFLTSLGGTISALDAGAIRLFNNDEIAWTSTRIDASNDSVGIFVAGQPGHFRVAGSGSVGSGGTIQAMNLTIGPDFGAIFDYGPEDVTDTDNVVELNDMVFTNANDFAIDVDNLNTFTLNNTTITQTGFGNAVNLSDVVNMTIADSVFTANPFTQLNATIGINPADTPFNYAIVRSQFVDTGTFTGSSQVSIDSVIGGFNNTLNLLVQDNGGPLSGVQGFVSQRSNPDPTTQTADSAALNVRWNGELNAVIERNSFALLGGIGQEGVEIVTADASAPARVVFRENTLVTNEADEATGVRFDFAGPAQLSIVDNATLNTPGQPFQGFRMFGEGSEAYDIRLRNAGNIVRLRNNEISLSADDTVGFNFPFIGGNSRLIIDGNRITHNVNNITAAPGERGFAFGPVLGTVFFEGTVNNEVIYNTGVDAFSRPFPDPFIGSSVGTFFVNEVEVPN